MRYRIVWRIEQLESEVLAGGDIAYCLRWIGRYASLLEDLA